MQQGKVTMSRPSPQRLAEIREYARVCFSGPISRDSDNGRALNDALAEIDALRVERDAAQRVAAGTGDLHSKSMDAIHEAAGIQRNGLAGILGWIDEARAALNARELWTSRRAKRAKPRTI